MRDSFRLFWCPYRLRVMGVLLEPGEFEARLELLASCMIDAWGMRQPCVGGGTADYSTVLVRVG